MIQTALNRDTASWLSNEDRASMVGVREPAVSTAGGSIRTFRRSDIPRVCELFSQTFRFGKVYRTDDLAACLEATYFRSPSYSEQGGSIVHVDRTGTVDGFLGVIAITMVANGRRLRGGILGAYMAADPEGNPRIGVGLARGILARDFDVLFTDTANRTSLDFGRANRFMMLPVQSLEWVKLLRPAGSALYVVGKRFPRLASGLAPVLRAADSLYLRRARAAASPLRGRGDDLRVQAMAPGAFADAARPLLEPYHLKPAPADLAWLVAQAELQLSYGALHCREVLDRSGRRIGLYLLYARRGGVAYALQVLALPNREEKVVGQVIADAAELGAVAVRGAASACVTRGLIRQTGTFYRHMMGTIAWTRDPDVALALKGGDILVGGLVGETWARIVTEDFS